MKKILIPTILAFITIILAFVIFNQPEGTNPNLTQLTKNVVLNGDSQIINIAAKGGYSPRNTTAKANTATTLKIQTNGTFDCSSSLIIPTLKYRKSLPPTGETTVEIPPQKSSTSIRGLCSMGMFNFTLNFN
jgi:plastocyanin domain-containing protein